VWIITRSKEIATWIAKLDDDSKEAILKRLIILQNIGPSLGRPYVDTVKQSKYKNMKEMRIQTKEHVLRIFFAFDPKRQIVLLIGGDKRNDKNFYDRMIQKADQIYENHLKRLEGKNEK